jgi:hypothetical protein
MSDYRVKISVKSDNHALHNLSSNPTDKVSEFDNKYVVKVYILALEMTIYRKIGLQAVCVAHGWVRYQ